MTQNKGHTSGPYSMKSNINLYGHRQYFPFLIKSLQPNCFIKTSDRSFTESHPNYIMEYLYLSTIH